jgi:hypothetical protein
MKKRIICSIAFPITGLLACVLVFVIYQSYMLTPYKQFREEEQQIRTKFEKLNLDTLQTIPPPPNVSPINVQQSNANTEHGVILRAEYPMNGNGSDTIIEYYRKLLEAQDWQVEQPSGEHALLFYKQTGCVELTIYDSHSHTFILTVWYDFLNQEFSPKMPPLWLVKWFEYSETQIDRCPRN